MLKLGAGSTAVALIITWALALLGVPVPEPVSTAIGVVVCMAGYAARTAYRDWRGQHAA